VRREYYFSVDNLCKDLFLRKHMDSQGFVLLSVIASFKRIKTLTEDMELLRAVCRQLKTVDYRPGDDGLDRLRKREKWEQWVLSMEMRDPSAQNDGPPPPATSLQPNPEGIYEISTPQTHVDGTTLLTNGSTHHDPATFATSHYPLPNGGTTDSQMLLSSIAPDFSPFVPVTDQSENVNVGSDENTFPDDQIENLVIVVRKPGISSPAQSPFLVPFSNGSIDGSKTAGGAVNSEDKPFLSLSGTATNVDRYAQFFSASIVLVF
jgi:la-related protein 1